MNLTEQTDQLLRCMMQIIGRSAMSPEKVYEIVGDGKKQITAFNLCDGTRNQSEVATKAGIDSGNFSRTFTRWVQNGIAFRIGEGKEARLMHIYSIPRAVKGKAKKTRKR